MVKNRQANSRMKTKKNIHHSHKNKYPYGAHAAENSGLSQCSVTAIMQRSDSQLLSHMLCLWCQKWTVTNFFDSQFASKSRSTIFLLHNQNLTYQGDTCRVISCAVSYIYKVISLESSSESWICFTYKY